MTDQQAAVAKEFSCPNPSCKKSFSVPLKAVNVLPDSVIKYSACPYCLTEITQKVPNHTSEPLEHAIPIRESLEKAKNDSPCNYHLGYLSERSQNDKIPDECVCCKSILECMLKKMRA